MTRELLRLPNIDALTAGSTYDLRVGRDGKSWNFLKVEDRKRARDEIMKEKTFIVIGGPRCSSFSNCNANINYVRMDHDQYRGRSW